MKVNRRTASRDLNPESSEYEVTFYPTVISHEKKRLVDLWNHSVGLHVRSPLEPLDECSRHLNIMQWDVVQTLHF
jgi:hypothetical protein